MIVTVTMNAALDRTLTVPNFQPGQRHRASGWLTLAGGKGINIARALKRLDVPVVATGLAGGRTGAGIISELTREGILNDFVRIADESRTSTAVVDPTGGSYTEINEWGPQVEPKELDLLLEKLRYLSRGADGVVFAGSLPRGVGPDLYFDLIRMVAKAGITTVVDTDGEPLRHAVRAEPHVISPNILEAEELVGHEFNDDEDMIIAVREMRGLGAREAIMTTPDGCFATVLEDGEPVLYRVRIEPRETVATVGAGDAFLAGYVAARYAGASPSECLRQGVACGAESTQRLGAGLVDASTIGRLLSEIQVERVTAPAEVS